MPAWLVMLDLVTQAARGPSTAVHVLAALAPLLPLAHTRISAARAGDSPVRAHLMQALVATQRCFSISELARIVGVSRKTTDYHLRVLESLRLVARRGDPEGRPLFAATGAGPTATAAHRCLEHPARRALHEAALRQPSASLGSLAAQVGLSTSNAAFHARVLERHGLAQLRGTRLHMVAVPLPRRPGEATLDQGATAKA